MAVPTKGAFPHFLIKEIHEQPEAVRNTILAHIDASTLHVRFADAGIPPEDIRRLSRINIAASGTSRHAGIAGRAMIHELARIPVEVDYASELEVRSMPGLGELTIVITQSGETADTLAALRKARELGSRTLAITNVVGSTVAREADAVLYTHAGPEISIASTKAFTAQLAALYLLAVYLGEARGTLHPAAASGRIRELLAIPGKIETTLKLDGQCCDLALSLRNFENFMFLGRGIHYAMAMDGALKFKETSYIHAEGYPGGEIKHGPVALVDEHLVAIVLAARSPKAARDFEEEPSDVAWKKTLADLRDIKQHGARVVAIAAEEDGSIAGSADVTLLIPSAPELLLPILEIVPLQLFAYHMAVARGSNVDQPRNLAKAVIS